MKKIDLIHTTILIVAILTGYSALQTILSLLAIIVSMGEYYHETGWPRLLYTVFLIGAYAIMTMILVRNSRKYANAILRYDQKVESEDHLQWQLDRQNMILVVFIGFGLYTLLDAIPKIISDATQWYVSKAQISMFDRQTYSKSSLVMDLLRLTIGTFLIYAAPQFSRLLEKQASRQMQKSTTSPTQ